MKMKRFFLVLLAMLLALSVFTACDDDDDSRAYTEEDDEIIGAILDACSDAIDDEYCTISYSGTTATYTLKNYSCTVTSYYDSSDISVTIKSGSTIKYVFNSSVTSAVTTYDIDATVDGTSRTLYLKCTIDLESYDVTFSKIELDGVELTGIDDFYATAVSGMASRTLAV